ncbi:P-loop containing nucleoside triphosphate hydrolase protein [Bombardia bombarda]|uniref:P-loop containing nucleoside triphosphate hydrolase protein n=1 Tax=Bombardia bombarda TaxID=252184 RepID=A0AA39TQE0_9PEZI|nr:P-loop containing nucleoside triphosphate hydrolase protein [Bombardia bombarda]
MATLNNSTPLTPFISSSHVSILDFFVPGSTGILATIEQVLAINSYARTLFICMLLFAASNVNISYSSEVYDMIIPWLVSQPFAHRARSSIAHIGCRRSHRGGDDDKMQKKPLSISPWSGTFYFFYKGHLLWYRSMPKEVGFRLEEVISVSAFGSPTILKQLFNECRDEYLKLTQNKTPIFEHQDCKWKRTKVRDIRPISTVVMDEEKKTGLIRDIETFLDPQAHTWHANRGIPYRRGYLLHGPPGTGKSSLCVSVAGKFNLEIYILNLSSVDSRSLSILLAELPTRCVLLLEDVDAEGSAKSQSKEKVALSDLLNTLDGVASQEGRVLIMTTNHIEHLDPALIRAGCADQKIELPNANKDAVFRLFYMVFKQSKDDIPDLGKLAKDDEIVERRAHEFAEKIPEYEFSPVEI